MSGSPLIFESSAPARIGMAVGSLGLGGALLALLAIAHTNPTTRWAAGALGAGLLLNGVAMLVFAPFRSVSIDHGTRHVVIDKGTRFHRRRRVLPFSAILRLELDEVGDEETGYRHAVRAVLRNKETVALTDYARSYEQAILDRQAIERVLTWSAVDAADK